MLTLGNIVLKQTHFYQEIAEEERQKGFQRGFEEGFQEGFQEGLQEYRQEQNSKMVSRMIRHKFGINTESHQAEQKLSALSIEQLQELAENLLDFTQLHDLNRWLASRLD